jgi:L-aminopeptidase/D-esterase-like protein
MVGVPNLKTRAGSRDDLLDIAGVRAGHATRLDSTVVVADAEREGSGAATGASVVLIPEGATASVDVRGGGPGTRETDLLAPHNTVQQVHAIMLAGGSSYGLAAADGVMRWLDEHGTGLPMGRPGQVVPIVPGAIIFDLPVGSWEARPTAELGYEAASNASDLQLAQGCVGAGTGARAGELKGGVGSASVVIEEGPAAGVTVAALMVANPMGSVVNSRTGLPWGVTEEGPAFWGLARPSEQDLAEYQKLAGKTETLNTTIGVVVTDAALDKSACHRVAMAAHDGLSHAVRPAHLPLDGDTIFAISTGSAGPEIPAGRFAMPTDLFVRQAVCEAAALVVRRAIVKAVLAATDVGAIPTYRSVFPSAFAV